MATTRMTSLECCRCKMRKREPKIAPRIAAQSICRKACVVPRQAAYMIYMTDN